MLYYLALKAIFSSHIDGFHRKDDSLDLFAWTVNIKVVGYDQTKGYAQELGKIATEDAVIVQQIKRLGKC